jgi:NADPH-dependent 2,4-dienoyl-CoA reductase/sulfur reductase-like enzyme
MRRVTIVGASIAGVSAAQALRERGFTGEIELLDSDPALPYDRPPLSKQVLSGEWREERVLLRPRSWFDDHRIALHLGTHVQGLDLGRRVLRCADGSQRSFEGLVIATGSVARELPMPVERPERVHRLRTAADARRLRAELVPGRHLVIVGAGFIGLEVAAVARAAGLRVTVVETAATPMQRVLGPTVGRWFHDLHQSHGVAVWCGVSIESITYDGERDTVQCAGDVRLEADLVLAAVGAAPACDWLEGSGLRLGDGVVCEPDLCAGAPDVVVAGDAARWENPLFDRSMRVEHWTNAVEQANHAVGTLLGSAEPYRAVPYFWSDQYDAKVRFVGLAAGHDEVAVDAPRPGSFLALFGARGRLQGALCVNLPRRLAQYRDAIDTGMSWEEAMDSLHTRPTRTTSQSA